MNELATKEKPLIKGHFIVRSFPAGMLEKFKKMIEHASQDTQRKLEILAMMRDGKIEAEGGNLIMVGANTGFSLLAGWLIGDYTYGIGINYGGIGTSNTAPLVSDTKLTAEYARAAVSFSQSVSNNEALLQFFFPDSTLANQTYYEAGGFVLGNAAANSGQIFDHALFNTPYVKTAGVDTILELDITLSQ